MTPMGATRAYRRPVPMASHDKPRPSVPRHSMTCHGHAMGCRSGNAMGCRGSPMSRRGNLPHGESPTESHGGFHGDFHGKPHSQSPWKPRRSPCQSPRHRIHTWVQTYKPAQHRLIKVSYAASTIFFCQLTAAVRSGDWWL